MEQRECRIGLERKLVHHCTPTLASIKPANLFVCRDDAACGLSGKSAMAPQSSEAFEAAFTHELAACRNKLAPYGVRIEVLARRKSGILLYTYRPNLLRAYLSQGRIAGYLQCEGYNPYDLGECIMKLHKRISGNELTEALAGRCAFPHEIGFFLGYPYDDVIGFIENEGENSICTGCWKVYSKARDARACFCRYKSCTAAYEDLYDRGTPIEQLACGCANRRKRSVLAHAV